MILLEGKDRAEEQLTFANSSNDLNEIAAGMKCDFCKSILY